MVCLLVDYKLFLPEALLTLGFLLTVILVLMFPGRRRISFLPVAALAGVAVHLGFSYDNYGSTLNGLLTIDPPTVILRSVGVFLGISLILVLVITARRREEDFGYRLILLTLLMVGVFVLFTSSHLVSLFLALELIAGPGYLLARGGQKSLGEASTRFLLLGIFSSLLIAFGFSFLFGLTNQATFNEIAISEGLGRPALLAAAFLVMLGLFIKIGAFPLQGALLELVPRASSVVFILLIAVNPPLFVLILLKLAQELFFAATDYSFWLVGFFSVLSMVGGNVLSLQSRRVRMSLTALALAHGGVIMAGYLLAVEGSFLSYHHLIPETVYTITSATTKPTREFEALDKIYHYYKIKREAFLGYEPKKIDGVTVLIAEPEKALVDYLYFVSLKKKALNERLTTKNLNRRKVLEYAEAFKREGLLRLMEKIL
ncbi:hypothetical protein HKBW3C_02389 [Candidatus Hakubella thermalkaliphila]|nr:hypothetical protein HKBW3C_02389 [Candidatus Hakubella thermalkaliphila]